MTAKQQTSYTIPAAMQTKFQPRQATISNRVRGSDLLELISVNQGQSFDLGHIVTSGMLTAQASARLATLSRAYQRIKWHSLKFMIESSFSTVSGGGFVACFVRDPDDQPPEDPLERVRWAMAQQQSADSKWYESVGLNVGEAPDLLFTSATAEKRTYSPGEFFIVSKGGPGQVGTITVSFSWDVTLSEPTIDLNSAPVSVVAPFDCLFRGLRTGDSGLTLARVKTASENPTTTSTTWVTGTDLTMEVGDLFALPHPVQMLGQLPAGSEYYHFVITHCVVCTDGNVVGLVSVGDEYFAPAMTTMTSLPPGFETTIWSNVVGCYGNMVLAGEELKLIRPSTGRRSHAYTQFGLREVGAGGKRRYPAPKTEETVERQTPLMDLSGER